MAFAIAAIVAGLSLDMRSPGLLTVTGAFALLALLLLGVVLVAARAGLVGAVLAVLAALSFGHAVVGAESSLGQVGLVGVGLLLIGELSQWSLDGRLRGSYQPALHRSRAIAVLWLALAGLGTTMLTLVALGLSIPAGLGTVVLAVAATVALLGLISIVSQRTTGA